MNTRANPNRSNMTNTTASRPTATATTSAGGPNSIPAAAQPATSSPIPPTEIPQVEPRNVQRPYARLPMPTLHNTNFEAWFRQLDYWFLVSGYQDEEFRVAAVLTAIDTNVLAQIDEEVTAAPIAGKYNFVKQKLIAHYADSEQRKLNRLLSEMPLGDQKPSELYFEMKRVAGNVLGDVALKGLWAQRLPEVARPVIAASSSAAAEFTKIADTIVDALAPRAVQQVTAAPVNELDELKKVIAELRKEIKNLPTRSRSQTRSGDRQRQRTSSNNGTRNNNANSNTANNNTSNADECWYHQKYGNDARKCRSPCRRAARSTPAATENQPSA